MWPQSLSIQWPDRCFHSLARLNSKLWRGKSHQVRAQGLAWTWSTVGWWLWLVLPIKAGVAEFELWSQVKAQLMGQTDVAAALDIWDGNRWMWKVTACLSRSVCHEPSAIRRLTHKTVFILITGWWTINYLSNLSVTYRFRKGSKWTGASWKVVEQ